MLVTQFFKKKSQRQTACIALFSDTLALAYQFENQWHTDEHPVADSHQWGDAIKALISRNQLKGTALRLVLGHGYYQSMMIEKPELPQEEYPTALPFLVKELVNESPQELVADGFLAPLKQRLQVFVANRRLLEKLAAACRDAGCDLTVVSVEDVVWGQLTAATQSQVILHRRSQGNLQLTAFKEQVLCFQRQLRGFAAPLLVGQADDLSSGLQLDGLALELQRSLDFLSAQLRETPVTQMLVSCDDDDDSRLAQALGERLSVPVVALTPAQPALLSNALRVAQAGAAYGTGAINLYNETLKPKTELLTLPNIAASWLAIAILLGAFSGWCSWQNHQQQLALQAEQRQLDEKRQQLDRAKAALARHLPSVLKVESADGLEQHLAAKQATLAAIAQHDDSLKVGYAGMLQQLSDAASGDISLQRISVAGRRLDLEGLARSPDSVPSWLQAFKTYPALSDRRFELMSLGRTEDNIVTFKLLAERSQPGAVAPSVKQGNQS